MTSLPQECSIAIPSVWLFNFADQSDSRFVLLPVAGMRSRANAAVATNQNQALHGLVGTYAHAPWNENRGFSPSSPDPFPPFGGGVWGRDYNVPRVHVHGHQTLGPRGGGCVKLPIDIYNKQLPVACFGSPQY